MLSGLSSLLRDNLVRGALNRPLRPLMYLFNYSLCWKICCLIAIAALNGRTSIRISSQLCLVYVRAQFIAPFLFAVFLDELSDTCNLDRNRFIVVYADDILLISTSVVTLENLIHLCERELNWLDMAINYKKILLPTYWTTM